MGNCLFPPGNNEEQLENGAWREGYYPVMVGHNNLLVSQSIQPFSIQTLYSPTHPPIHQPIHSAPPQQQLIYAQQQGMQHAHMQAMQARHAHTQQQMGFPQMMVGPGQPGQHPYGAHPLHMSQGPPQKPNHPAMGPPQQQAVQAPHFQPRGQSQGPPNQQGGGSGGPGASQQQGPPQGQGQQPPRPGGADAQGAPPPASTPPQGPPSLGHNGPPAPQQPQPPQGPPAHSGGPPSGTSTLTRERKRIAIIDPTTRHEVSVDGTSADKKVGTAMHDIGMTQSW